MNELNLSTYSWGPTVISAYAELLTKTAPTVYTTLPLARAEVERRFRVTNASQIDVLGQALAAALPELNKLVRAVPVTPPRS